jgi:hypothetical protein
MESTKPNDFMDDTFERYTLEEMALADQIRLFSGAEVVVAPHGAGLVHLLFGRDLSVVELFPEHKIPHHYYCLAEMLGFDNASLVNERVEDGMLVDPEQLRATIESVL